MFTYSKIWKVLLRYLQNRQNYATYNPGNLRFVASGMVSQRESKSSRRT